MKPSSRSIVPNRRDFLIAAGSVTGSLTISGVLSRLIAAERSEDFQAAYAEITKNAQPITAKIKLEIDAYIENGRMVFYRFFVDHPMTSNDYVKRVHLLSTENPFAHVARFNFTPQSGRAAVAGRMRLAKTQEVVAIAELAGTASRSDRLYIARRYVQVAIGGCES